MDYRGRGMLFNRPGCSRSSCSCYSACEFWPRAPSILQAQTPKGRRSQQPGMHARGSWWSS